MAAIQSAAASPRARFTLRQRPDSDAERAESYQVRQNAKRDSLQAPAPEGVPLTSESENLPEYVVYETTYQAYPRILAFGGIKRAEGAAYSSFSPVTTAAEEGEPARTGRGADASPAADRDRSGPAALTVNGSRPSGTRRLAACGCWPGRVGRR